MVATIYRNTGGRGGGCSNVCGIHYHMRLTTNSHDLVLGRGTRTRTSASHSRFAMMDHYTLGVHKVDVQIMQLNNCIQCLACICDIIALFDKAVSVDVWLG